MYNWEDRTSQYMALQDHWHGGINHEFSPQKTLSLVSRLGVSYYQVDSFLFETTYMKLFWTKLNGEISKCMPNNESEITGCP